MEENLTSNHVMNIYKELSKLTTDVSLLCQRQETFKDRQQAMADKIDHISTKIDEYNKRFDKIDNLAQYKGSWIKGFERNWWKILLFVIPIVAGLFEFALWLKNMPVT